MTTSAWARFACNVWTQGDDAAIATLDWARKARPASASRRRPRRRRHRHRPRLDPGHDRRSSPSATPTANRDEALIDERLGPHPRRHPARPAPRPMPPGSPSTQRRRAPAREHLPRRVEEGRDRRGRRQGRRCPPLAHLARMPLRDRPQRRRPEPRQWIERELCDGDETRVGTYSQQPAPMAAASMHFAAGIRTRRPGAAEARGTTTSRPHRPRSSTPTTRPQPARPRRRRALGRRALALRQTPQAARRHDQRQAAPDRPRHRRHARLSGPHGAARGGARPLRAHLSAGVNAGRRPPRRASTLVASRRTPRRPGRPTLSRFSAR
jgi:hypothetical protein